MKTIYGVYLSDLAHFVVVVLSDFAHSVLSDVHHNVYLVCIISRVLSEVPDNIAMCIETRQSGPSLL
jgi:hypothetical protein